MAYGSFEDGGITVQSSELTDEQLAANLTPEPVVAVVNDPDAEPVPLPVEPAPKAKPRSDPQARVEAATAKEAAAKRERDDAKAESATLAARLADLESRAARAPVAAAPVAAAEPQEADFADYRQFVKAQARWEAKEEFQRQAVESAHQAAQAQRAQANEAIERQFAERYRAVIAEDPEFTSKVDPRLLNTPRVGVLADPSTATFGNFLVEQVFQSEHPKEVLLHLSDATIVQRLATLPPAQVIRELAKFEYSLGAASPAAPAPQASPVSHAKAPIRPVVSSPMATDANEITDDLSVDEHIRRMNAKDRAARRAS